VPTISGDYPAYKKPYNEFANEKPEHDIEHHVGILPIAGYDEENPDNEILNNEYKHISSGAVHSS
jgi:hypothetical protein